MTRLPTIDPTTATGPAKELLDAVQAKLGLTPNMTRVMANSPAVLGAYLAFSEALGRSLNARLREQVALVIAEDNRCEYCLSAHTAIGKGAGLSDTELLHSRDAQSTDPKTQATLRFARAVNLLRGQVSDAELQTVKAAGLTDAEIAEVVALVALNGFTNTFNNVAQSAVDFSLVRPGLPVA